MHSLRKLTPLVFMATIILSGCNPSSPTEAGFLGSTSLPSNTPTRSETVEPGAGLISTQPAQPSPTPSEALLTNLDCTSPAPLTPLMTEGPYFKPNSPERTSLLEPGMSGTTLTLTGYVLTTDCQPVPNALLDFWQADSQGQYDNSGYILRGHQFTDGLGMYKLETVVPGLYPGRTAHIHLKVQAPDGPVLTTQLFFPGESGNQTDRIFDPSLLIETQTIDGEQFGKFNFVVDAP